MDSARDKQPYITRKGAAVKKQSISNIKYRLLMRDMEIIFNE